jgi:hypothetical protein
MEHDNEIAESKARAEQLIGRNVLLFQEMERLLKVLLPRATVSISRDCDVRAEKARRHAAVEKSTLGNLVNRFIDEILVPNEPDLPDDSGQVRIDASIRLKFDAPEERDAMIQRLTKLVDGRNQLVHHLLSEVDVNSSASWRSIQGGLEEQQRQILAEIETFLQLVEATEMSRALVAHPEFKKELAYGPMREQLIERLRNAAGQSSDPDGWTSLREVIRMDGAATGDSLAALLKGYEIPTVSAFLEAVGGFEVRHVADPKGKSRTFFRIARSQHSSAPDPGDGELDSIPRK